MSELETGALGPGRIESRELEQEMRSSFLGYAMHVIVSRALPDVRDGLKPVHRRVLFSMWSNGNRPGRPHVKSANIVGYVMGNHHPHGDASIYDTLVRMAQPFSLRYPLVDGKGNFGSIDDDPPAAMRYTEARLAKLAEEMLRELDSDTVDFGPNYDESKREPLVLPARFPNLLVNGSAGIAVGMATNIPPHNLAEVVGALVTLIDKPDANVEDLMKHVKGPDFPTGAIIVGRSGIRDAYRTGRGRVVMRARAHIEELRGGKSAIIVTELPYGVKKGGETGVIAKIADLVNDKVITEISDLQDHSDRSGMRIHIELKRDAVPQVALNKLFKHTPLQSTFGVQRGGAGERRAADAVAARDAHALPRLPARDRHAPLEARAAPEGEARAHPAGLPDRARQPRRGDRADPAGRRHGDGEDGLDGGIQPLRDAGRGDPRAAVARADRARAARSRERVQGHPGAHRRAARAARVRGEDRCADQGGAPRAARDLRARATIAGRRSSPPRRSSSSRT